MLWLDANKGVTVDNQNHVSKWADQSGKGNDAAQSVLSQQPTVTSNVINGASVVRFAWTSYQALVLADASSLDWGNSEFAMAVVARIAPNGQDLSFYGKGYFSFDPDDYKGGPGLSGSIGPLDGYKVTRPRKA